MNYALALLSIAAAPSIKYTYPTHPTRSQPFAPLTHHLNSAKKTNIFNILFIKKAWGWTSGTIARAQCSSRTRCKRGVAWRTSGWRRCWPGMGGVRVRGMVLCFSDLEQVVVASGDDCIRRLRPPAPGEHGTLLRSRRSNATAGTRHCWNAPCAVQWVQRADAARPLAANGPAVRKVGKGRT